MQSSSNKGDRMYASTLLARTIMPEWMDSARVYLQRSLQTDMELENETGMAKIYYDLSRLHLSIDSSCEDIHSALCMLKSNDNNLHPSLSPSEIRLCAMLRPQLSTEEIAEMIKRSPRTIEYTRSKIRKKMAMTSYDNLTKHLLTI